jgi:hypothetical protein
LSTLIEFIIFVIGALFSLLRAGALFFIGFAVGFALYVFLPRRRRKPPPELQNSADLEGVIGQLETELGRVEGEVDKLYKQAGYNQTAIGSTRMQRGMSFNQGGRWHGSRGWFNTPPEKGSEAESYAETIKQHLSDIKRRATHEAGRIHQVRPFLAAARPRTETNSWGPSGRPDAHAGQDLEENKERGGHSSANKSESDAPIIIRRYPEERPEPSRHPESSPTFSGGDMELVELYNRAVTDSLAREQFRERYQAVRLGTVNAVERRQNPTIAAEYRETSDGDFLAFAISGRGEYAVVPRLGLTIESVRYNAGALGEVFGHTQGYDPQHFYSRYSVREPAIFKCDGDRWTLQSPGKLELGQCD